MPHPKSEIRNPKLRIGPSDEAYRGCYDRQALSGWAGALSSWTRHGHDAFCFFDNDEAGYAPQNALELQDMLA